jgi:hypothetical protein
VLLILQLTGNLFSTENDPTDNNGTGTTTKNIDESKVMISLNDDYEFVDPVDPVDYPNGYSANGTSYYLQFTGSIRIGKNVEILRNWLMCDLARTDDTPIFPSWRLTEDMIKAETADGTKYYRNAMTSTSYTRVYVAHEFCEKYPNSDLLVLNFPESYGKYIDLTFKTAVNRKLISELGYIKMVINKPEKLKDVEGDLPAEIIVYKNQIKNSDL